MEYVNGFAREEFLRYMYCEFPGVLCNAFTREMLENVVDYGLENHTTSKNGLYYFLKDMIPEVVPADLIAHMDKQILTDEVLCLVEGDRSGKPVGARYNQIVLCDLVDVSGDGTEFKDCYLLTGDGVEIDEGLEVDLSGDFCFNTEFASANRVVLGTIHTVDELVDFCERRDIHVPAKCLEREGCLCVGAGDDYVLDASLFALGWAVDLDKADVDELIVGATAVSKATEHTAGGVDFDVGKE